MRVLHFAGSYFPVFGGTTTRLHNMLSGVDNEHELFVPWPLPSQCPSDKLSEVLAEETQANIHIHRVDFDLSCGLIRKIPFIGHRFQAREFVERAESKSVDIIHGHNPLACALASLYYKREHGLPMVFEVHRIMGDFSNLPRFFGPIEPLNKASLWLLRQSLRHFEGKVLRTADMVIAHSESAKQRLIHLYGLNEKSVIAIPNGVNSQMFDPERWEKERSFLRNQRGWQERIVCLYAGRLDEVNGTKFFLSSITNLRESSRGCLKVVLLGRGPCQDYVERFAKEHSDFVEFLGPVKYEDMPRYYAACDVLMIPCLPTLPSETQPPTKLQEAMAMGKIVLVSSVASIIEVVKDGENGLVFEKGNRDDFLRKLETIVEQADNLEKLGQRARQDVLDKYTWEASRKELQSVYEALLE